MQWEVFLIVDHTLYSDHMRGSYYPTTTTTAH